MKDLYQPLLSNLSVEEGSPGPIADSDALRQIRSVLIKAGITADMINLPMGSVITTDATDPGTVSTEEEGGVRKERGSSFLRALSARAKRKAWRRNSMTNTHPIPEDIYSMFFLSKNWALPFWYSLVTFFIKFSLLGIVLFWIYKPDGFRDAQKLRDEAPTVVKITQFLLISVAISITKELMLTFTLLGTVRWKELETYPHATRMKFWAANAFRALDGLIWLLIITSLMLYAVDILEMYLNFAALQFLQSIDDAAYKMALEGYMPRTCERVAKAVADTELPTSRYSWHEYLDTILFITLYVIMVVAWALVNYVD